MLTENVLIGTAILAFLLLCLGAFSWFLMRPMRHLQTTIHQLQTTITQQQQATTQMQTILTTTQTTLALTQQEAVALRRALTSTTIQGQWGEMQLERIVSLSGMEEYCDFTLQETITGVKGNQRPDLLVKLSNGRRIAVDAKAPIDAFIDAHAESDTATRTKLLKRYAEHVRGHVTKLANKEYWRNLDPSPAWVVLLIPNEGMFRAALEHDFQLLEYGAQRHVLLASPISLIALLKAMAYGWQQEKRAQNVQQIVDYSHTLHRELVGMSTQWKKLSGELGETIAAFNQLTMLYQETIVPQVHQIRELDGTLGVNEPMLLLKPLPSPKEVTLNGGEAVVD